MLFLFYTFDTSEEIDKFEKLYRKNHCRLHAFAVQILKDQGLAEDVVQDAFIRVSKNLEKIDDPTCKKSFNYMVTIVKNLSYTILEQQKRRAEGLLGDVDEQLSSHELSPQEYCITKESYARLFDAVKGLNDTYRSVVELRYYNDLSYREIADILQINEDAVAVRLHRAHRLLLKILQEQEAAADAK